MNSIKKVSGNPSKTIELENHGRSVQSVNVSRTIGWFTSLFPVEFILEGSTHKEQLLSMKEQVKASAESGNSHFLVRHFMSNNKLQQVEPTAMRFNYLGEFAFNRFGDLFELSDLDTAPDTAPENHMTANIEIICMIREGRLQTTINYNAQTEHEEIMEALKNTYGESLQQLLHYLAEETGTQFTPSDFETAELSQEDLDSLFN